MDVLQFCQGPTPRPALSRLKRREKRRHLHRMLSPRRSQEIDKLGMSRCWPENRVDEPVLTYNQTNTKCCFLAGIGLSIQPSLSQVSFFFFGRQCVTDPSSSQHHRELKGSWRSLHAVSELFLAIYEHILNSQVRTNVGQFVTVVFQAVFMHSNNNVPR